MKDYVTFSEFLTSRVHGYEVDNKLQPAIDDLDVLEVDDPNNLFAVSPHFLKCCAGEPQDILQALVVAYNHWIIFNLKSMTDPVERCITANRVIFVEDAKSEEEEAALWKGLNSAFATMSGCLEDLMVHFNYMRSFKDEAKREKS